MIYWAKEPDALMTSIVDAAFDIAVDYIRVMEESGSQRDWEDASPQLARIFSRNDFVIELKRLDRAHRSSTIWRLGDYHWLLLYSILRDFCELYNDAEEGSPLRMTHEGTSIQTLDFDALVSVFFWDLDFLLPFEDLEALGAANREQIGLSQETFALAAGLKPHPEELKLEEVGQPKWEERDAGDAEDQLFKRGCPTYPSTDPAA